MKISAPNIPVMSDRLMGYLRDAILGLVRELQASPVVDSVLTESVTFTAANEVKVVDHKLGRAAVGWVEVVAPDSDGICFCVARPAAGADLTKQFRVENTNAGACRFLVF